MDEMNNDQVMDTEETTSTDMPAEEATTEAEATETPAEETGEAAA